RRVVAGLGARLRGDADMLAPHAVLTAQEPGTEPSQLDMFEQVALQLAASMPRGTGRLRLPGYRLLHAVLTAPRLEGPLEQRHRALRDHCYAAHCQWSTPAGTLWWLGGRDQAGGGSLVELLWNFIAGPLFQRLPRALYGARATRRILGHGRSRRWYAEWYRQQHGAPPTDFFRSALELARGEEQRDPEQTDRVLMHALLADLDAAVSPRRLSPWRRRRTTRFVLLFEELGHADSRTQRFVRELRSAAEDLGCTSVLAIGAGARSLAARVPDLRPTDLAHAGAELDLVERRGMPPGTPSGMIVPLREDAFQDDQQAAYWLGRRPRLVPPTHRWGPAAELLGVAGAAVLALLLTAGLVAFPGLRDRGDDTCLGGTFLGTDGQCVGVDEGAAGFGTRPSDRAVRDVLGRIERQNAEVDAALRGRPADDPRPGHRTVVYFGPLTGGKDAEDPVRGGTLPELRGIAIAQQEVNRQALTTGERIPLRVLAANAGDRFRDAPAVADHIVELAGRDPSIIGVVGFGQSRRKTYEAMRTLNAAGIPMVGTSGTADELLRQGPHYYQIAPTDERAGRAMAAFAADAPMIHTKDAGRDSQGGAGDAGQDSQGGQGSQGGRGEAGDGERATRVRIVADPTDAYSNSLAASFRTHYGPARAEVLLYTPGDAPESGPVPGALTGTAVPTVEDLAREVCEAVREEPRTALVWSARASQFTPFLSELSRISRDCPRVSVLGGDDVTNTLVQDERPWDHFRGLTLYYVSHGLASAITAASTEAATYLGAYDAAYGGGREAQATALRDDGHATLAWDALRYLAEAVDQAWRTTGGHADRVDRPLVQGVLYQGLGSGGLDGATGRIEARGAAGGGRQTENKLVRVVRGSAEGPRTELLCGVVAQGDERRRWGPEGERRCP
ncbi:ABC transporter substrate-binding protein, partial [Streptomyces sp. URMC 123]|uniref:ABC transporter substrate-binding protein n=1 Tax=Streptomyces sp. URMC 123 TaxID=3423403 RepID=UPI003F19AE37